MVIPREPRLSDRGLRRDYTPTPKITKTYLLGVLHDATERKSTYRIATKSKIFCDILKNGINKLGANAWSYKEGKNRDLWIVEFSKSFLSDTHIITKKDKVDYIRGYFDAEGGIAKDSKVRFYIYFCQKDFKDLNDIRNYLIGLKIICGKMHNPSKRIDPDYWRFFISVKSYSKFAKLISSNHPDKFKLLRMKI